jgi:hypothetical protein
LRGSPIGPKSTDRLLGRFAMIEWYLVWIEGLRGPEPQKWSSDALWGQLGRQDVIVRFDQLAKLHPVPIG